MASFSSYVIETPTGRCSFAESGRGPTRVLLHSLLTDRTAFDEIADGLGGRVVELDLPGFGSTDPAAEDIDDHARRVAGFIETLGLPPAEVTVLGNGLGAFVALGTAIHHGHLFDRLVLVGCGTGFPDPAKTAFANMVEAVRAGGMEAVIPIALRRIYTEDFITGHPDAAAERAAVLRRTDPDAFISACQALRSLDYSLLAAQVSNPTLIVVGEEDQATPPDLARELHGRVPGSTLVTLPGIAHAPQLQDPTGFIAAIRPFLEGI